MAKSSLLNTRTANYLELVGNGRTFRVPPYQRDYSWAEEQWDDLWGDIQDLRLRPDDRHYMGALVVEARSDRDFLVIDGQQRLATLGVLSLAVIQRLGALTGAGPEAEANAERASALRSRFIGEKDPASLVERSKLFLNATNDGFWQDHLVQLRAPIAKSRLPRSNRLLWECLEFFRTRIEAEDGLQDGEALARLLSETIGRQLLFILITVEDDLNAYTVFETLNARGIELSATDLLKNYLFSRVASGDLDHVQRRWLALMEVVQQERFPSFLRHHLRCEIPRVRSERLFKVLRDKVRTPTEALQLLGDLEARGELFAALSDPDHEYWSADRQMREHVRELILFGAGQVTPVLFAAWEVLRAHFASVLRLASIVTFRHSVVAGLNTNELEPVYHAAARAILEGRAQSPQAVFETIRSVYVGDDRFVADFSTLTLDAHGQRNRLAKYILCSLEADAAGRALDHEGESATIEHVLPLNPSDDWSAAIPPARWDTEARRVGNLCLLEEKLNRGLGSAAYARKVDTYARSAYTTTRYIAESHPDQWTVADIQARQEAQALRARHIWRWGGA